MRKTLRRDVGHRAARLGAGDQHGAFENHSRGALNITPARVALDTPAAGSNGVVSSAPVDRVAGGGVKQRQHPPGGFTATGNERLRKKRVAFGYRDFCAAPSTGALTAESRIGEQA